VTLSDVTTALHDAHTSITQQEALAKVVIKDAQNARAEFRAVTTGATNPLVNRALGNYAQAIVRLRDGAWLLAEAGGILAEYARTIGIDLGAIQPGSEEQDDALDPDKQPESDPSSLSFQRGERGDAPSVSQQPPA
jgi:hypothetical protein